MSLVHQFLTRIIFYFSILPNEALRAELVELAYHVCSASNVLAFGVAGQKEIFLPYHFCKEREILKKHDRDHTLERDKCLTDV